MGAAKLFKADLIATVSPTGSALSGHSARGHPGSQAPRFKDVNLRKTGIKERGRYPSSLSGAQHKALPAGFGD